MRNAISSGLLLLLATVAASAAIGAAPRAAIPSVYYGNTLVCRDAQANITCHVWFDSDGRYYVFFDLGKQPQPATPHGPFQFEGREGTYTVRMGRQGLEACLHPSSPKIELVADQRHALFAGAACYVVPRHALGDQWQYTDTRGQPYTLWLLAGR